MALETEVAALTVAANNLTSAVQADTATRDAAVDQAEAAAAAAQDTVVTAGTVAAAAAAATLATAVNGYIATATTQANRASTAADAAAVSGQLYANVAAGEAATATGVTFKVVSTADIDAIDIRTRTSGGSTLLKTIPSSMRVATLETLTYQVSDTESLYGIEDDFKNLVMSVDASGRLQNRSIDELRAKDTLLQNQIAVSGSGLAPADGLSATVVFEDDYYNAPLTLDAAGRLQNRRLDEFQAVLDGIDGPAAEVVDPLMPDAAYGQLPGPIKLYAAGILPGTSDHWAWGASRADYELAEIGPASPTDGSDITVECWYWGLAGTRQLLGSFPVKWAPATLVSPATPQVLGSLGDSTMLANRSNQITDGSWLNELGRRLYGVGNPIVLPGVTSPPAGTLTNIKIVGTLGAGQIKHEGRPAWSADTYATKPNSGGISNPFWNPNALGSGVGGFDMAYYARNANFFADGTLNASGVGMPGGILADFSNFTLIIALGWNAVYASTIALDRVAMNLLLDRFHATAPGGKVVIKGLTAPPKVIFKSQLLDDGGGGTFASGRVVSQRTVFEDAIKATGKSYRDACSTRPWAHFHQVSHLICPETAFPKITIKRSARSTETITGSYDYVHSDAPGYAEDADALYYYFAKNMFSGA